jgi:4a-hydroxytetrahydrobiopterin dehydratase
LKRGSGCPSGFLDASFKRAPPKPEWLLPLSKKGIQGGGMPRYSKPEILAKLKSLDGWRLEGDEIKKKYEFPSFPEAMKFVNKVADLAEQADHHPDILINYRRVTLTLSTHDEGGITQKDFDLAEQVEREGLSK